MRTATRTSVVAVMLAVAPVIGLLVLVTSAGPSAAQPYNHDNSSAALGVSARSVPRGGRVGISGSGFAPYSVVSLYVRSTPVLIGTTSADGNGAISVSVALPASVPPGNHTLTATGPAIAGGTSTLSAPITVGSKESGGGLAVTGANAAYVCAGVVALALICGLMILNIRRRRA